MRYLSLPGILAMTALLLGCAMNQPTATPAQQALMDQSRDTIWDMKNHDPGLADLLKYSDAYVIFPSVAKGGVVVGGATGQGVVYENGHMIGYAQINQGSVGAQLGAETYAELIVFQSHQSLLHLEAENFEFGAEATATLLKAGSAEATQFQHGAAVFVMPHGGAMADASLSGQKFYFEPISD